MSKIQGTKNITISDEHKICKLYSDGISMTELTKMYHTRFTIIRTILQKHNIHTCVKNEHRKSSMDITIESIRNYMNEMRGYK